MPGPGPFFKVRLASGRVLGPLDLVQAQRLIEKGHITGSETARAYPEGDWCDINQVKALSDLVMAHLLRLADPNAAPPALPAPAHAPAVNPDAATVVLPPTLPASGPTSLLPTAQQGATRLEIPTAMAPPTKGQTGSQSAKESAKQPTEQSNERSGVHEDIAQPPTFNIELAPLPEAPGTHLHASESMHPSFAPLDESGGDQNADDDEATRLTSAESEDEGRDKTQGIEFTGVYAPKKGAAAHGGFASSAAEFSNNPDQGTQAAHVGDEDANIIARLLQRTAPESGNRPVFEMPDRSITEEKTIVFDRSKQGGGLASGGTAGTKPRKFNLKQLAITAAIGFMVYTTFFEGDKKPVAAPTSLAPVRPKLPTSATKPDPQRSQKLYTAAMKFYVLDNVVGYRKASDELLVALSYDMDNVKALAMLASCYLNLIDSSNKDENYFTVISKLIELSRAKALDLAETVIADVEFYVTVNRPEAAQERIVAYTKTHRNFEQAMFYYIATVFAERGDLVRASQYLTEIPDNKAFSPKLFYLRGQIAQRLGDDESAYLQYEKGIKMSPSHALSRLRMVEILARHGKLRESAKHLESLLTHATLLPPKELAKAQYLQAQLLELVGDNNSLNLALYQMERATRLDRENHDYVMELYTLRARLGDRNPKAKQEVRMFEMMTQGEKQLKLGQYHEALTKFLEAREANLDSPYPPLKIGDMFRALNDIPNARLNYQLATKRLPRDLTDHTKQINPVYLQAWTKYINVLIESYDWEEAKLAMEQFRKLPVSRSSIDKASGDLMARQGKHSEALGYYRKAMGQDTIDSDVYMAYARSLYATKNYKDAPFFYALALRFDPLNNEAIIGTAKSIAGGESLDRAIDLLNDELQKSTGARAEILTAVAELEIQKGEWSLAQKYIDQAMQANPEYALPWKLQAQIYTNQEGIDKKALDRALDAYKSYSDRNTSDPSGYLERFKIYLKKTDFEHAGEELQKIYGIYPKYPNLHYYKAVLYSSQGNHKVAAEEFTQELQNNPGAAITLISLGKELIELGAYEQALDKFNQAMGVAPTLPEPKHLAGYASFLLKQYPAAVALLQAALAYDKGNPTIYKRLGTTYRAMGDAVQAREAFKKYLEMEPDAPDKGEIERSM